MDRDRLARLADRSDREARDRRDDPDARPEAADECAAFAHLFRVAAAVRDIPHAETRPLLEAVHRLAEQIESYVESFEGDEHA